MKSRIVVIIALIGVLLSAACDSGSSATQNPTATPGGASGETPTAAGGTAMATSAETPAGATATPAAAPTNTALAVGNANARLLINGAGATFPLPIYTKWFQSYSSVDPNVKFNYQAIGSGAGIQQVTAKTVDFGASDAPMTDKQIQAAQAAGGEIYHIPTVAGAVAIAYNLQGVPKGLKLDGDTLAKIYTGDITSWDDPAIKGLNPDMAANLKGDIVVVHRSDGSGTTNIFTSYLSAVSPDWKSKVGAGTSVNWPVGLGGRGNAGVAGLVQQTPGAIGYVELAYVLQNNMAYAVMKNANGEYVEPTLDATVAGAAGVTDIPADLRVMFVNSPGKGAYPIAGFTYILVYKTQKDAEKGAALARFLWWATHDGQAQAKTLQYAPLPASLITLVEGKIKALDCGGSPCYK